MAITSKSHFSEREAAEELGVSIDQLRSLIRNHIVQSEDDMNNLPVTNLQPSDLLVLKLLSGRSLSPTIRD